LLIQTPKFIVTLLRKRIKNINLRIKRTGEIQVSAPLRTPLGVIHHFLDSKYDWIDTHQRRLQSLASQASQTLATGNYIIFQGQTFLLDIQEVLSMPRIELNGNRCIFFVKPNASQADKEKLLNQWHRTQMQQYLPTLLDKWQTRMSVTTNKINVRLMRSRWGSCHSIKKHITLNLRLIEKPLICLEYVLVHELVHLFEASHNQRFYALMDYYLPDWKQIKKQLNGL
jgi:predicted metal-dependent hydrolase